MDKKGSRNTALFLCHKTNQMKNIISEIELKYNPTVNKGNRIKITCPESAYKALFIE